MTQSIIGFGGIATLLLVSVGARAADAPPAATPPSEAAANNAAAAKSGNGAVVNGESLTTTTNASGPAERFGHGGQIAISSDNSFTISSTTIGGVPGSITSIQMEPAVDYFLIDNLSIGGFLEFMYVSDQGGHAFTFGVGPRVGYNFTLSDLISFWPKVGLSIADTSTTGTVVVGNGAQNGTVTTSSTTTNTNLTLNLYAPLMFHPAPHFFAGIGPFLDVDLTNNAPVTTWGAKITLGGWVL
jgi:hypothetical protein